MRVFCRQPEYRNNFEAFENNLDRNSKNPAKSGAADCGGLLQNRVTTYSLTENRYVHVSTVTITFQLVLS